MRLFTCQCWYRHFVVVAAAVVGFLCFFFVLFELRKKKVGDLLRDSWS